MKTYTRTPLQVKAVQWDGTAATMSDIVANCDGFRVTMNADHQLISVETSTGIVRAHMGDWLVLESTIISVYSPSAFSDLYMPVATATKTPTKPKKK